MAKMTIQELIARKEQLKNKKFRRRTLFVESLDAEIVIQEPSREIALEVLDMVTNPAKADQADIYATYQCVVEPNLKDVELQKAYGCIEPTDIVSAIFRAGEIAMISGHALQLSGYSSGVKVIDSELKN